MFKPLRLVRAGTQIPFVGFKKVAFVVSFALIVGSMLALAGFGLNFGIDFRGGILMEVRSEDKINIITMRDKLADLKLGEVNIQEFGKETDALIRIQKQEGAEKEQLVAINKVKSALGTEIEYRRTEFVGPTVGEELKEAGLLAIGLALLAILIYIWLRFEWQFGVGAIIALTHDVLSTIGIFALTGIEFNLSTVAAILTIAGYSINDTVVIFDRVRENLRKYKNIDLIEVFNMSINNTLSRTVMTSITTLLALISLYLFGGEVIKPFALTMIIGVLVGTYSSIFIAVPTLLVFKFRPQDEDENEN